MASLTDIVAAVNRLQQFSAGGNWNASHNDAPIGPVENVGLGSDGPLFNPRVWIRARFQENGQEMVVRGEHDVKDNQIAITFGQQGSGDGDGEGVDSADELVLSNRLVTNAWRVVLEYAFETGGEQHRYRFDGTAIKADDIVKGVILG